ncbi:MAG: NAD synthetase / Glutamine amidotransferase chain of NAD synthetase, partial [uncultured Blastococcus sp.]
RGARRRPGHRLRLPGARLPAPARPGCDAAERARGGVDGPGDGAARLRAQERLLPGRPRPLGGHRLRGRGRPRRRRPRAAGGHGHLAALQLLLRALPRRRRRPRPPHRAGLPDRPDRADGRRVHRRPQGGLRGLAGRRGEPPGARARHHPDGAEQLRGAPGARHVEQERALGRLLHPLRRLGRRLRPAQGRAEDAGLGARAVAQRRGGAARADPADPRGLDHQGALGGAAPRADRPGHPAALRAARRGAPALRRAGAGPLGAAGRRLRRHHRRRGGDPGRPGRVEAPAVRAGHQDQRRRVRARPPPADHQPLARERVPM